MANELRTENIVKNPTFRQHMDGMENTSTQCDEFEMLQFSQF